MQIPENILVLIEKYQKGQLTTTEKQTLDEWYHSFEDTMAEVNTSEELSELQLYERIKNRLLVTIDINKEAEPGKTSKRKTYLAVAAAVAFLALLSTGAYYLLFSNSQAKELVKQDKQVQKVIAPIIPGGNKAILTLADGSTVVLDSTDNGTISEQGNIKVKKLKNGVLAYEINGKFITENDELFYNTISTPRGGQYQVTLSDGTNVWLNAASSIRFPVVFVGKERKVEITGEAYMEVAKNKEKPFKVKAGSSEIEVLGTHFNVNAYDDEASIKTTLLEGAVKISAGENNQAIKYLKPGQQSSVNKNGNVAVMNNADIEEAVAWKNGLFIFKSTDVKTIMRQISRWYNVDVEYKGNVNLHFTGQLTRNEDVKEVFEKIALTDEVHFKIDGRRIIVSP